ncbi:MAG: hypothetical protein ACI8YI_002729, partial [Paracoccaceae bacterium]
MAKLPYGFDANPMYETRQPKNEVEAWERLDDVQLSLEKGEVIAPELAAWLGEAIEYAKRDPAELLRRLGLKRGRGKPAADPDAWLEYGQRVCELEDEGLRPEASLAIVLAETNDLNQTGFTGERKAWKVSHDKRKFREPFFDRSAGARSTF